jgi:hypothetical protein
MLPDSEYDNLTSNGHVEMFSGDEARELFDRMAWYYLQMSGNEFLRRWDEGEFQDDPDSTSEVMSLVLLMPLVGR